MTAARPAANVAAVTGPGAMTPESEMPTMVKMRPLIRLYPTSQAGKTAFSTPSASPASSYYAACALDCDLFAAKPPCTSPCAEACTHVSLPILDMPSRSGDKLGSGPTRSDEDAYPDDSGTGGASGVLLTVAGMAAALGLAGTGRKDHPLLPARCAGRNIGRPRLWRLPC